MADRFPSIEDLDAGQTPTSGAGNGGGDLLNAGDESDFLARERAVLGDDADAFATSQDAHIPSVQMETGDDLLGGTASSNQPNGDDLNKFQSSFPAIDSRNERVAPGGTITGTGSPFLPGMKQSAFQRPYSPAPSSTAPTYPPEEEPQVVKEWRERRQLAIQAREDAAASRKDETVKAAQESIDEFYENYNNKKEKNINQTRKEAEDFLAKREDTAAGGTSWERIAKLVDVQKGGKGLGPGAAQGRERFRDLLVQLMKDENAPGAKGY